MSFAQTVVNDGEKRLGLGGVEAVLLLTAHCRFVPIDEPSDPQTDERGQEIRSNERILKRRYRTRAASDSDCSTSSSSSSSAAEPATPRSEPVRSIRVEKQLQVEEKLLIC